MNRENEQKYDLTEQIVISGTDASQNTLAFGDRSSQALPNPPTASGPPSLRREGTLGETAPYRLTAGGTVVNVRFRPDGSLTSCLARALCASM